MIDSRITLHDFAQNQIWLTVVALTVEFTAWMQLLALTDHPARRWEPQRLRCGCSPDSCSDQADTSTTRKIEAQQLQLQL